MQELSHKQKEIMSHAANDKFSLLSVGSIRSGKTYSAAMAYILYTATKQDGLQHVIAGANTSVLTTEVLNHMVNFATSLGFSVNVKYSPPVQMTIGNSTHYVLSGKDKGTFVKLRGRTIGSAFVDECALVSRSFYNEVLSRLSYDNSKIFATCNPDSPSHWIKTDFIDKGKFDSVVNCTLDDNPTLSPTVKKRYRDSFTGVFYKRMILGKWVASEGAIYTDPCIINTLIPENIPQRHIVGVDYGMAGVTAFVRLRQIAREDYTKITGEQTHQPTVYVCDKVYRRDARKVGGITDEDLADELIKFCSEYHHTHVYCDPSANSFLNALRAKQIGRPMTISHGDNDVINGIRTTMNAVCNQIIVFTKDVDPLLIEMDGYVWDSDSIIDKPVKEDDHCCDALRYAAYSTLKGQGVENVIIPRGM